jgi:para-aminobenzoate synthetase component I
MRLPDAPEPFVLLDDARDGAVRSARLYVKPIEIVRADRLEEVSAALERLRQASRGGLHAAGYMSYEAGFALEPRLSHLAVEADGPLLWFGLFNGYQEIAPADVPAMLNRGKWAKAGTVAPDISQSDYGVAFAKVQEMIRAGDIYQANLSFGCMLDVAGDMVALYAALRPVAKAGYGAIVMTGECWLLSLSPELFFTLEGDRLITRPMKGTAVRLPDSSADAEAARLLASDPKQRAENLMIVDLLRNDLSRVAVAGSVAVPHLFAVETYPTVHQMTSTVTARLQPGRDAVDALTALFPCGSITGAPKLRAMEIIHATEQRTRGAYTGAIGRIDATSESDSGGAEFNVAIRTICVKYGTRQGSLGLGSAVVADSICENEWVECLDKARFLDPALRGQANLGARNIGDE